MNNVVFIVLRRMRLPFLVVITLFAFAITGLVLVPGPVIDGKVDYMDFFHAFYFFSYTATTIGFGEVPYNFSDAQRLWIALSIYLTVVGWFYAIGTLVALLKDQTFQQALAENRFTRRIRNLRDPFYLVCGYGETGSALVRAITDGNRHAVVLDKREERIDMLQLENLREYVPALHGDARRPHHLIEAGLRHPMCSAVVALTDENETNLKVAIAAKLMHPDIKVICRADSHEIEANMAAFGTDHIFDPFDIFGSYLANAIRAPGLTLMRDWLSGIQGDPLKEPFIPPAPGLWILCGYGRFGKAIAANLKAIGIELLIVEAKPELTGWPEGIPLVMGRGTESRTLEQAEVRRAVGLVAGTDDDASNLSIIMTARTLNPKLFVVVRENHRDNEELFQAVGADIVMHPSTIIAERIRVLLVTPLLTEFEQLARERDEAWSCELVSRLVALDHEQVPEVWEIQVCDQEAHALCTLAERGLTITLGSLPRDPRDRDLSLPVIPLMLVQDEERTLLPSEECQIYPGDRLLLCGRPMGRSRMGWTLLNLDALNYVLTGGSSPEGAIWQWLSRPLRKPLATGGA